MTTATLLQQVTVSAGPVAGDDLANLKQLPTELLRLVSSAASQRELLVALAELVTRHARPVMMHYYGRDAQGQLLNTLRLIPLEEDDRTERLTRQLAAAAQAACRVGACELRRSESPALWIVGAPVVRQGRDPEAFGFVFSADLPAQQAIVLAQLVAAHVVLWHVLMMGRESEQDARTLASLVELRDTVCAAPDLRSACFALAGDLQTHLKCRRVAIGLRPAGKGNCRLVAISGVAQFDALSAAASAIEAAMDEAVLRNEATVWPATDDTSCAGALAHKQLCMLEGATAAVGSPLRNAEGTAIGAVVLLGDSTDMLSPARLFLRAAEPSIAGSLIIARRVEGGRLVRMGRTIGANWRSWQARVAASIAIVAVASLAIPLPYRLHCDCQIEPVTRRFIAAPFEGTLEKSLVKPGDIVREGDLLARMDGREIRWKRASVAADQSQAIKKRDSAQAVHNYAEMQIAALEMQRLELELQLLDHRAEHLEIKSPVAGIVVSGDLERAEGAPLTIGQTLFEIAPLEQMVVEVAVADADVSLVRQHQPIAVRLDAFPHTDWQAEVSRVHPRAEIRDESNVFIAEAQLDNSEGRLSPGMKGRATVDTDARSLGWILFHKPWEYASKKLRW